MKPRSELPWRSRQQVVAMKKTWWARVWASRTIWSFVGGGVAWVLANGAESMSNLRKLPSELQSTYHMFQSWFYDDALWTGTWSSREEGHIDDYKQAEMPLKLTVDTERGKVSGEMFNRSVCELSPMLPPVLLEGEIVGGKLVAYAFAYVGGERKFLYSFSATRSDREPVVTLSPLRDPHGLVPPNARLVQRIDEPTSEAAPALTQEVEHADLKCAESSVQYIHRMLTERKKSGSDKEPTEETEKR